MTVTEVINMVDDLSPNYYTPAQKLAWLASLDGKIYEEVILTHEGAEDVSYDPDSYVMDGTSLPDITLLVEEPYAADVYSFYLMSRIASANAEISKYDQYAIQYNTAYSEWTSWYNRKHLPLKKGRWVL